jgi:hypothetical protein
MWAIVRQPIPGNSKHPGDQTRGRHGRLVEFPRPQETTTNRKHPNKPRVVVRTCSVVGEQLLGELLLGELLLGELLLGELRLGELLLGELLLGELLLGELLLGELRRGEEGYSHPLHHHSVLYSKIGMYRNV